MSTNHLVLIAATFSLSLALGGCDDDDDREDAAVVDRDAGRDAAARDAEVARDAGEDGGALAFTSTLALTTEEEVPPCAAAGATATGTGTVTIDAANTRIDVVNLTFSGLSGPLTGAHIHPAPPGEAGPIVLDLGPDLSSPINRSFTAADYPTPPPAGAPADFAAFVEAMRAGDTYVNLHTADCMPGEIRDQIE